MDRKLFFVDAETDGLYGAFLSVAVVVTTADCREVERSYYGIRRENLHVRDPWVREHVLPIMGDYIACEDEAELLEQVWKLWEKYRKEAYAIGDVISPVEARLFAECARSDSRRTFLAPYPLLDLSSLLYANGIDPLEERSRLLGGLPEGKEHNALDDVLTSIEIYRKLFL